MGWSELEGIANRTDFDLRRHAEFSGEDLSYFDQATQERYVPYVIEPSAGADRGTLAFMVDAFDEEEVAGRKRTLLRLHPRLAPVKVAVLPLVSREGMPEKARAIYEELRRVMPGGVRRGRLDRQALPPPGRDRHAVGHHDRRPDDGGRHRHAARPRLARADACAGRAGWPTTCCAGCTPSGARRSSTLKIDVVREGDIDDLLPLMRAYCRVLRGARRTTRAPGHCPHADREHPRGRAVHRARRGGRAARVRDRLHDVGDARRGAARR